MGIKTGLPRWELYLYSTVLYLAMLWTASWIYDVSSSNVNRKSFKSSVTPGWHYFSRRMDTADFEWVMWFSTFREHIIFALSGHVIFAKICSMLAPEYKALMYMFYGMMAVLVSMGWTYITLILSHCVLLYTISLVKLRWLCFLAGLTTLSTFKMEPFVSWQASFVMVDFELRSVLFYGGCGFTIVRSMSFALENCQKKDANYSILELLKYNFYLPFFYFGPIMTFDKFHAQANRVVLTRKEGEIWNISLQGLLHLGAIITADILFHFLYILTIPTDMKLLKHASDWALVGVAYCNLVYDWVKSAVMFGVVNTVARLDHLDPPQPPKCITMLYVFSETHFDRGINDWLCKYVYDYLGRRHDNVLNEAIATMCTFGVTILWLGPCQGVFLWAFFNCLGLNFELWTAKLLSMEPFTSLEMAMSPAMSRRIRALFNSFNFWTIVLYNIIALNSPGFTSLVAKRLLLKGFPVTTLTVLAVTYCLVQLIKERERRQALIDDPDRTPPPAPVTASTTQATPTIAPPTASVQPIVDPSKEKAE
ncbi:hedgehog acyltransferase like, b [Esox lucius]|uniref:Hedgehog acyltransferase like, a n=1 Tax=Esox lucius TaxID=8010 RepID=A0A3P8XCG5_ESOLU|nr:hedgehog acyltransferase like, b [Esox lucius]XP_010900674.1 hedgehog acyltransferase like, b [Esox lucius]